MALSMALESFCDVFLWLLFKTTKKLIKKINAFRPHPYNKKKASKDFESLIVCYN